MQTCNVNAEMLMGYQGVSGSCYILIPISGSDDGELYVVSPMHTGSITGSSGFIVYGSGSDGLPHPVGVTQNADGTWSLQTDTELILSGNIVISNVKTLSVDGTSASLVYGLATADGTQFVTSSYDYPVHAYDRFVSGSIVTSSFVVSGSVAANTSAVYAVSGSTVNTTNAVLAASSSIVYNNALISGSVKASMDAILASNALISGSTVNTTNAVLAVSSSIVNFSSASMTLEKYQLISSMFKYQLGVDGGSFYNDTTGSAVYVFGTTAITGSTICPWIFNATDVIFHQVNNSTVTTASFAVTPIIPTASASLMIKYNAPTLGLDYATEAYRTYNLNPEYSHVNGPAILVSESNGAQGLLTSSDVFCMNYDYVQFQLRMACATASFSGTLSDESVVNAGDWYSISGLVTASSIEYVTGSTIYTINNCCPSRYHRVRMNYFKTAVANQTVVRVVLH